MGSVTKPDHHFASFCHLISSLFMGWSGILLSSVYAVLSFNTRKDRSTSKKNIQTPFCTQTDVHKRICGGRNWKQSSYLQSQRFPSHVLEQSRGGGERALRAFLQRQGDACRVPTQQIHQVLQLPAHLENNNSMMGVSSAHRQPHDSDDRNNKLTFKCEHPDSDWIGDSTFIPFTHDLDDFYLWLIHYMMMIIEGAVVVIISIRHVDRDGCRTASEVHVDEDVKCKAGCQRASCTDRGRSCDAVSPDVVCWEQLHAL